MFFGPLLLTFSRGIVKLLGALGLYKVGVNQLMAFSEEIAYRLLLSALSTMLKLLIGCFLHSCTIAIVHIYVVLRTSKWSCDTVKHPVDSTRKYVYFSSEA